MKPPAIKSIFIGYWIIALLDITGIVSGISMLHYVCKPLLMPMLVTAAVAAGYLHGRLWIILGLLFAFAGDVLLLFPDTDPLYFMAGLSAFLLTHVFYIRYFISMKKNGPSLANKRSWLVLLIAGYSGLLLYILVPKLGNMLIPVIIYACTISVMVFCSLLLPFSVNAIARKLFIYGAVLFVLSDSILAINKFYEPFGTAPVLIMLTYCLAQYFIVKGFLRTAD